MDWRLVRIARGAVTFLVVVNLSFFLTQLLPGGPGDYLRQRLTDRGVAEDSIRRIVETHALLRPDDPIGRQYLEYMGRLVLEQELGRSLLYNAPVSEVLGRALPWTVFAFSMTTWIAFPLGIVLGATMAYREGGTFDLLWTAYELVVGSIPYYIVGILLVFYLGLVTGLFPWRGRVDLELAAGFNPEFMRSALHHAALPALTQALVAGVSLPMRGSSIRVLGSDYVRAARFRGVPESVVITRYVGRNAILPIYTAFMTRIAGFFGGSVIIEMIFTYRGMGYYMFQAVEARDWPLMVGGFVLLTTITLVGIVAAELTYGYVDPRAREGGEGVETY